jgi:hypothetical protein
MLLMRGKEGLLIFPTTLAGGIMVPRAPYIKYSDHVYLLELGLEYFNHQVKIDCSTPQVDRLIHVL